MTRLNEDAEPLVETQSGTQAAMTRDEAVAYLCRADPRFELTEAEIRGVCYRVFKNAPPHLREFLLSAGPLYGESDVLVYQNERWDYAQLCRDVKRMANALVACLGVGRGDRVALAMRNYPELPILILAVSSVGAVAVPMNAWGLEEELAYAITDCGAKLVFADGPRYERIEATAKRLGLQLVAVRDADGARAYTDLRDGAADDNWPDVAIDPDDDFAVLYSSGSTGHPKGVVLTHRGAISAVYSYLMLRALPPLLDGTDPQPPARQLSALIVTPLFHVTALHSMFLQGLATGAKMSLLYKWDAEEAVRIVQAEEVTRFVGVPTQTADLMATAQRLGQKLETLESVGSGGAKRPAAQVGQLSEAFPGVDIGSGWGMTETNSLGIIASGPEYLAHPEAAGRLTPPLQDMRIVDAGGNELPFGEVGELVVKSPANMRCYLNQPEATAATLRDGWLYTGDLAYRDEDDLVYIVDRKKSIIIRGGENIACLEVEGALHRHPGIAEACVFPVPDARLGEVVGAAVHLLPGHSLTEAEIAGFLTGHLARFKIPDRFWFWPEPLPRGSTDKINRRGLREDCLARAGLSAAQGV